MIVVSDRVSELGYGRQFFPYEDINKAEHYPFLTVFLIVSNVIVFLFSLTDFENIIFTYGFVPAQHATITVFTSMFLHGGLGHIFGNLWYLWLFGDNVEDKFGKLWYLVMYVLAGIVALLAQYVTDPLSSVPTIGASGAISGVLGAYMVLFPHVEVKTIGPFYQVFRIKAQYLIALWFVIQLAFATLSAIGGYGSNIAFFAHVGGFVFGVIAGALYRVLDLSKRKG